MKKIKTLLGVGGTPTQRGGHACGAVRTVKNQNQNQYRSNLNKLIAAILALSLLSAPVAPASAAGSIWDSAVSIPTTYTADSDGFIVGHANVDNYWCQVRITTEAGKSYFYNLEGSNEWDGSSFCIPVSKGDKVELINHNNGTRWFISGGGMSTEDIKEELKKGTFENIKTQTLETTGNTTVDGNLTVKGNTQLGDSTADTTGISGNATVGKDLSVAGNETVNGNEVIRNFM